MKAEYYIGKKYFFSNSNGFIKIISIISTIGITLGVAALIVVISVYNGFTDHVTKMLINVDPHVQVKIFRLETNLIDSISSFLKSNEDIVFYAKFYEQKSLIYKNGKYYVINLKGYDTLTDKSYKNAILGGKTNLDKNELSIGVPLALRLEALPSDTVILSSFQELGAAAVYSMMPKTQNFIVGSIFETHNRDYDLLNAYCNLQDILQFVDEDYPNGFEIWLNDIDNSDKLKNALVNKFKDDISVQSWFDLHKELYQMMAMEKWAAFIILSLIIFVASFNILASLTMTVLKKKRDIAILKTLGLTKNQIQKIFYTQGILNGLLGTTIGLILGLTTCLLQIYYKIYPLDPNKYIIDAMPIKIDFLTIILIVITSILLSFIASIYPAKLAYKSNIVEAIKWE